MATRALIAALAIALFIAGYQFLRRWQLRSANRSTGSDEANPASPGILYFWSPSCTVCRTAQKPILDKLMDETSVEQVQIAAVDVTQQPELASRYRVLTVPTTVVIDRQGKIRHVNNGLATLEKLLRQTECLRA